MLEEGLYKLQVPYCKVNKLLDVDKLRAQPSVTIKGDFGHPIGAAQRKCILSGILSSNVSNFFVNKTSTMLNSSDVSTVDGLVDPVVLNINSCNSVDINILHQRLRHSSIPVL